MGYRKKYKKHSKKRKFQPYVPDIPIIHNGTYNHKKKNKRDYCRSEDIEKIAIDVFGGKYYCVGQVIV